MSGFSPLYILIVIVATVGAWYVFPHTISKSQKYRTSTIDLWCKRIGSSLLAGFGSLILLTNIASEKDSVKTTSSNKPTQLSPATSEQPMIKPSSPAVSQKQTESHVIVEAGPQPKPPTLLTSPKVYSLAEILEMEKIKQYSGDDPIVRARLGLPSRETGLLQ